MVIADICHVRSLSSQDTVLTLSPYPFVLDDPADVPLEECWFALPKLYFTRHLRPGHQQAVTRIDDLFS